MDMGSQQIASVPIDLTYTSVTFSLRKVEPATGLTDGLVPELIRAGQLADRSETQVDGGRGKALAEQPGPVLADERTETAARGLIPGLITGRAKASLGNPQRPAPAPAPAPAPQYVLERSLPPGDGV